jgi:hypothetical protein
VAVDTVVFPTSAQLSGVTSYPVAASLSQILDFPEISKADT